MTSDGKVLRESLDELLSVPALLKTLRNISTTTASDTKFCFFVDGLDEYDGRPSDIIELVDILKSFQNVKTCVSSRPWNEFEDHFGKENPWKLYMQEHTKNDIRLFVEDTLGENERFQQLKKDDPQCPNFVRNIVYEADGVFLWVFLVTRSLLEGLTNSDRIQDLQQRVNETPTDLQDYFKTILFSTENRYRIQTARIFTIAVNAIAELPLMAYWVADQENPNYMIQLPVETPPERVLTSRLANMERRLKSLSKGLLETRKKVETYIADSDLDSSPSNYHDLLFGYEVDFLHRTVKDYLRTPDAQLMLQTGLDENFNADLEICTAYAALAKMSPQASFAANGPIWDNPTPAFIITAFKLDQNSLYSAKIADILDDVQRAILPAIRYNKEDLDEAYSDKVHQKVSLEPDLIVITACVVIGLLNYVTNKFTEEPQLCLRLANHAPSLLLSAFYLETFRREVGILLAVPSAASMLELILSHGVDPNCGFAGQSEWRLYLELLAEDDELRHFGVFDCIKAMLRHGADFKQECIVDKESDQKVRADELLKEWFSADQLGVLQDIIRRREKKSRKSHVISKGLRHLQSMIKSKK